MVAKLWPGSGVAPAEAEAAGGGMSGEECAKGRKRGIMDVLDAICIDVYVNVN
jgi:hypothetical protein